MNTYFVIVKRLSSKKEAERLREDLEKKGHKTMPVQRDDFLSCCSHKGPLHRTDGIVANAHLCPICGEDGLL